MYSGNFAITTERYDNKPVSIQGGINQLVLDFTRSDVVDFVSGVISAVD